MHMKNYYSDHSGIIHVYFIIKSRKNKNSLAREEAKMQYLKYCTVQYYNYDDVLVLERVVATRYNWSIDVTRIGWLENQTCFNVHGLD